MERFPDRYLEADVDAMSAEELADFLEFLNDRREELDSDEPEDETSEAFVDWAEEHEALEDLIDEITERLEDN